MFFFVCIPCYVAFNCANILWSSKPIDRAVCGITCVPSFVLYYSSRRYTVTPLRGSLLWRLSPPLFSCCLLMLYLTASKGDSWNKHLVARKQRPRKNTEAFKPTELGHPTGREANIWRRQSSSRAYANFIHSVIKNIDIGVLFREEKGGKPCQSLLIGVV